MIPPILSQHEMDRIAAECREHARIPSAFWIVVGLVAIFELLVIAGLSA